MRLYGANGPNRGLALLAVSGEALHEGLPRRHQHPRLPREGGGRRLQGCARNHPRNLLAPRRLRTRLPAGKTVPEVLHDGQAPEGRREVRRHRTRRALLRGLCPRGRSDRAGYGGSRDGQEGRRRRLGPRVHHRRGGLCTRRPRRDDVRGLPQAGRRARLRHPRIPSAQNDRAERNRRTQEAWRQSRDELRRGPHAPPQGFDGQGWL